MSIIIHGLDMPKEKSLWLCIKTDGTVYNIKPGGIGTAHAVGTAVLLPEGHGRLGDLDALAYSDGVKQKGCAYQEEIFAAPTIIEADLEWKMKNCCCFSNTDQAEGGTDGA